MAGFDWIDSDRALLDLVEDEEPEEGFDWTRGVPAHFEGDLEDEAKEQLARVAMRKAAGKTAYEFGEEEYRDDIGTVSELEKAFGPEDMVEVVETGEPAVVVEETKDPDDPDRTVVSCLVGGMERAYRPEELILLLESGSG